MSLLYLLYLINKSLLNLRIKKLLLSVVNLLNFRLAFSRLGLLLVAVEQKDEARKECNIKINPAPVTTIQPQTQGFFIAQSADEVKRFLDGFFMAIDYNKVSRFE